MVVTTVDEPSPGPGEVIMKVAFGGCNFADTMMRRGIYPHPKGYPLIAGLEVAGTISAVGEGVVDFEIGDRAVAFSEDAGGFAEYAALPVRHITKLPDGISFDIAAAFFIQALTAWHLLHNVSSTKPGDVLLIHAIGGGVGLHLTQLAKLAGARVIGTVGTRGKEKRPIEFGADRVVNRDEEDFVQATLSFTDGKGVDKIIDSTGGSILDRSFDAIRPLGHVVSYGEAEAKPFPNLWERLVRKSLTFTRMHLGHVDHRSEVWKSGLNEIFQLVRNGTLKVPIEGVFPLDQVHAMYEKLESRQVSGKLLLQIGE
ncbi:MAG: zinc-binding dehydrogenase [Aquamicrobium sp.]|uniref:zinc-binding dehydrogenase n=1 Tax=Aquamicrobium sp. TaxID=1872579 RepID=UPI00349E492D|nr:zinc-binding dehydrogenase [Aquamicrobium sp.]